MDLATTHETKQITANGPQSYNDSSVGLLKKMYEGFTTMICISCRN